MGRGESGSVVVVAEANAIGRHGKDRQSGIDTVERSGVRVYLQGMRRMSEAREDVWRGKEGEWRRRRNSERGATEERLE